MTTPPPPPPTGRPEAAKWHVRGLVNDQGMWQAGPALQDAAQAPSGWPSGPHLLTGGCLWGSVATCSGLWLLVVVCGAFY